MRYKVGDKVRVRKDLKSGTSYSMFHNDKCRDNAVDQMVKLAGQIVEISDVYGMYKVKGNTWNWTDEMFEPVNAQKIVITCDAVETLARLYDGNKVVKTATAKCSPDDTFDFKTGAMLAFKRLMDETKKPMTFREKLKQEHPKFVGDTYGGGCKGCPKDYGYIKEACPMKSTNGYSCHKCWDREVPEAKQEPKKEEKWRVVKRKVKAGDYIRLKHNDYPNLADIGDVLKVHSVSKHLAKVLNKDMTHPMKSRSDSYDWNFWFSEFEVVEPINNEAKEEKSFKFEIGKQYQGEDFVIEITSAEKMAHDVRYRFKTIKGDAGKLGFFDEGSLFGALLKPYDPPKYYNGKAVCTATKPFLSYTVGKVYEFKNGTTVINNGNTVYKDQPVTSIEEWNELHGESAKMLEIVE